MKTTPEVLYGAGAILIVATPIAFISVRRHFLTDCRSLVSRLYPHQLRGITDLIDAPSVDGREFWKRTGGVRGLWKRWRNRAVLVQLCQESGAMEAIPEDEMKYILERALLLNKATLKALFFGLMSSSIPEPAGRAGQEALKIYADIAFKTHALYSDHTEHLCAPMLACVL